MLINYKRKSTRSTFFHSFITEQFFNFLILKKEQATTNTQIGRDKVVTNLMISYNMLVIITNKLKMLIN